MFFFDLTPVSSVKVWAGLIAQGGTNAPTATVIRNDLGGTIVWTRDNVGQYTGTLVGAFPSGKVIFSGKPGSVGGGTRAFRGSDDTVRLITLSGTDSNMSQESLKIEVYP